MDGPRRFPDWSVSGTKRSHTQMEGRDVNASRRTRSPSLIDHHSSASNFTPQVSDFQHPQQSIRLPSFRELDERRLRSIDPPPSRRHTPIPNMANRLEVIDLTGDDVEPQPPSRPQNGFLFGQAQRGPRFPGADIIDLSGDTPPQSARRAPSQQDSGSPRNASPEIQFLRERQLSPRLRFAGATPPAGGIRLGAQVIDITDDNDDEVQIVAERALPVNAAHRRQAAGFMHMFFRAGGPGLPSVAVAVARGGNRFQGMMPRFVAPDLNFNAPAFDLGYEDVEEREESAAPAVPRPPPAPEGFTRSPEEEDVLLCPNCDGELTVGEGDVKRQVWMIKGCGHVYCGECTVNRPVTKRKKGKEKDMCKTKPFKECVVEGCGKRATGAQMVQLFL